MLGLLAPSDPRWVTVALEEPGALLLDHFHCELKAASNATAIVARYPRTPRVVQSLLELSREELEHAQQVHERLQSLGLAATPPDTDPYAAALRGKAHRSGGVLQSLTERLLVAAMIEARSCERFALLRDHVTDPALARWYGELFASEARHYRLFASLAEEVAGEVEAREQLQELARAEAELLASLPLRAAIH